MRTQLPNASLKNAFTLVELLVVTAIIGILLALLLPAIQAAREAARLSSCKSRLKQIAIGMHNFESSFRRLPPGYEYAAGPEGNELGYSWCARLLPFMELGALYDRIEFDKPVFDGVNEMVREQHIDVLLCPSDDVSPNRFVEMGAEMYAMACYVANFGTPDLDEDQDQTRGKSNPLGPFDGAWGPFYRNSATKLSRISDGQSQTLMVGERQNGPFRVAGIHGPHFEYETTWVGAVRDIDDPTDDHGHMVLFQTGNTPNAPESDDRDVSAPHAGVAQFVLCDGSVHTVSEDIDLEVYRALGTMNQSEANARL
jgi:prepilin-type N-terminal cleavage/methylation domain-containing protein